MFRRKDDEREETLDQVEGWLREQSRLIEASLLALDQLRKLDQLPPENGMTDGTT